MCSRGVWQLKTVNIRYSETGHSSRGVRFYFRHLLYKWREKNPQVTVTTEHSQYEEPEVTAGFASNTTTRINLKNLKPRHIDDILNFLRNSHSGNEHMRHGGPRVWTEKRSVQGLWQPSLEGQMNALRWFHRRKPPLRMPRYTNTSLKLSIQAIRGEGRWGNEREVSKGWNQLDLKHVFMNPFVPRPLPDGQAETGAPDEPQGAELEAGTADAGGEMGADVAAQGSTSHAHSESERAAPAI
ncbi:unnamed protein product [Vitrella brassicaformis CCMP3155]|uniref:Large ribosomal subunit protein mL43 n=1 Tax=Vitrella brassicaformis (strain CCMP3155) TaxID=1169540 RepID=A0A0G4FUX2_VITBC|nr:unnamed protein product [Vitrella brassicaformis CCMP3155]|mmetsp:Transcript_40854/g.102097  ORF Transcript_40854/g.102097 Transcript_40854/m.102097 type:complete len:241 (-) Transcript_40854:565-1287(-)|eukprot:CEM18522.1 unnamed protein product [Vitrella brassicaformis CCMP3155]